MSFRTTLEYQNGGKISPIFERSHDAHEVGIDSSVLRDLRVLLRNCGNRIPYPQCHSEP
jgi:hypothetical protein